jgi:hypothetical protein
MYDGPQQLTGRGVVRKLGEQPIHSPEPDHQVVPVVTIAEHGIEPGEVRRVSFHDRATTSQPGADTSGVDDIRVPGRCGGREGSGHSGPRVRSTVGRV